jgi:hypothetical protein
VSTALARGERGRVGQAAASANALDHTFLIMLVTLIVAAGLLICLARRTYPRDVATAMASEVLTVSDTSDVLAV